MIPLDRNYIRLQFEVRIYSNNGTEFQSFFEKIMEKEYQDFRKIRPYGSDGDGGNDGYRKRLGIYYQVYAPKAPEEKEAFAAKKLVDEFNKLKRFWHEIANVNKYYFVYNDKFTGSVLKLEEAISKLEKDNPDIKFELFLSEDLKRIFMELNESDLLGLGITTDRRQAIRDVYNLLEKVEIEFDKNYYKYSLKMLDNLSDIIQQLDDENLLIDFIISKNRCLQKLEKVEDAIRGFQGLIDRFPSNPKAHLYLSEIFLYSNDLKKCNDLLERATDLDNDFWLLKYIELEKRYLNSQDFDVSKFDFVKIQLSPRIKSKFYLIISLISLEAGEVFTAKQCNEEAMELNPNLLANYILKIAILESEVLLSSKREELIKGAQAILEEVNSVELKFRDNGEISSRNQAILNTKKMNAFLILEKYSEYELLAHESFELVLLCYFDKQIDQILMGLLNFVSIPRSDMVQLLKYLKKSKNNLSEELIKVILLILIIQDDLFTIGVEFFKDTNNHKYLAFINDLKGKNYERILEFIREDTRFAVSLANILKQFPDLRRKIIEQLPNDKGIQKEKLKLLLNYDEGDVDEAFSILKELDLSKLNYVECKPILKIVQEKKAWDYEIVILEKLLEKEATNTFVKFQLELQLFNAYNNLKKHSEVISLGEQLLDQNLKDKYLNSNNIEALLGNTILACLERGSVEEKRLKEAKEILEKYKIRNSSFGFETGIAAKVYISNHEYYKALESIVSGVKFKKVLSPNEYANLYFVLCIKIGNQLQIDLTSLNVAERNSFIKFKNKDRWYYLGEDNELDAIKVTESSDNYSFLLNKKVGEAIVFENKFVSENREEVIESILLIDKYIFWQTLKSFQELSKDGFLEGVQMIQIQQEETFDPKNLLKFFDSISNKSKIIFDKYCRGNVPLALLAVSEGSLINALGRIRQEQRGYVNFCSGINKDIEKQISTVRKIIENKEFFYLDGTAAFVLSDTGLLMKV
ncbi:MAG: hypothetical protein HQ557_07680 [Bacteroidetes bacterium]|nr:hypothetical protein [Bacteroidota bacterium]